VRRLQSRPRPAVRANVAAQVFPIQRYRAAAEHLAGVWQGHQPRGDLATGKGLHDCKRGVALDHRA